jgi:fumarate reductase subunit D
MIQATHRRPGFLAALLHRLSGIALAVFLPVHFVALGTALTGADGLDAFFAATNTPIVKGAELVIVIALTLHLALGLRVLAIEFLRLRERTAVALSLCLGAAFAVGLGFLLNV